MLNARERKIMESLYSLCRETGSCLCSSWDLLRRFPAERRPSEEQAEKILHDLESDGYINLIRSERQGEPMYVVTLRANGIGFLREKQQMKRNVCFKIFLTVVCAVGSFLIGLILKAVFS